MSSAGAAEDFDRLWAELAPIGRDPGGGYQRLAFNQADLQLRAWFRAQAEDRGLTLDEDGNGNQWAWWGEPGPGSVVTGSHLDSVPGGGAYDGPLGVVSSFLAVDRLRAAGFRPSRSICVANFCDEEGGRFGVACAGSRLLTGSIDAPSLLARTDREGVSLAEARRAAGLADEAAGPDLERVRRIGVFVELHVEQGRALIETGSPVGVASAVWPHGRWRLEFRGKGDHAGTTRIIDRADPVIPLAHAVLGAREAACNHDALATIGRIEVLPGATNAIANRAVAWLDARAPHADQVRAVVDEVATRARHSSDDQGVGMDLSEESYSGGAEFGIELRDRLAAVVKDRLGTVEVLATGAGHDAAILAAVVPSAMLFVRNPTGVSHDPAEHAERDDCLAGVAALTGVLEALSS